MDKRLNDIAYLDFGHWNQLDIIRINGSLLASIEGHAGDFFPETPEDYLRILRKEIEQDWPIRADIDITNICNHRCLFCFSQLQRLASPCLSMNIYDFINILDKLVSNGTISIRFCGGGEPLSHPTALEILRNTLRRNIHITLLTNGDLFTEKFQSIFLRPYTTIRFSIDAYDANSRAMIHNTSLNSYNTVMKNIMQFANSRSNAGLTKTIKIGATYLIHPYNYKGIMEGAQNLNNAGVDYIAFRPIKGKTSRVFFSQKIEFEIMKELDSIKKNLEVENFLIFIPKRGLFVTDSIPSTFFDTCLVCRVKVIIEADCAVQICPRARGERSWRTLGVINSSTSFNKIWKTYDRIIAQSMAPNSCSDCIDISSNKTLNGLMQYMSSNHFLLQRVNK